MIRPRLKCLLIASLLSVLPATTRAAEPSDELVQQIVKLLGNPDREFRAAGLERIRTGAKGPAATR